MQEIQKKEGERERQVVTRQQAELQQNKMQTQQTSSKQEVIQREQVQTLQQVQLSQKEEQEAQREKNRKATITKIKKLNSSHMIFEEGRGGTVWCNGKKFALGEIYSSEYKPYFRIIKENKKYRAKIWISDSIEAQDLDIISDLLSKINWADDISITIKNLPPTEGLRDKHIQLIQMLLQNNSDALLRDNSTMFDIAFWRASSNNEYSSSDAKYDMRCLAVCLDFCAENAKVKRFVRFCYDVNVINLLATRAKAGDKSVQEGLLNIGFKAFKFARNWIIVGETDVETPLCVEYILSTVDRVRGEDAHKKGRNLTISYNAEICKLRCRDVLFDRVRVARRYLIWRTKYTKMYRKEVCMEMESLCNIKQFQQIDIAMFYAFDVHFQRGGFGVYCRRHKHIAQYKWQTDDILTKRCIEALSRFNGVIECDFYSNKLFTGEHDKDVLNAMTKFLKNNYSSLRKLKYYCDSQDDAYTLMKNLKNSTILYNLREFSLDGVNLCQREYNLIYYIIKQNRNLCIFNGIENMRSGNLRQKIEMLLNKSGTARFCDVE